MSSERIIFWFIVGWIVLIAVLIALDWMANPNRGSFRPRGEHQSGDELTRRQERRRRRLEEDASVRAALRDAYGASSLRLGWDREQEDLVRRLDDSLIISDHHPEAIDTAARDVPDSGTGS